MKDEHLNILLVEDNLADARLLREEIADKSAVPCTLVHVEQLSDALERLQREAFDVILLDLSLPDSQGAETLSRLQGAAPDVPVVVLTGLEDEALGLQMVAAGAQDYLTKGQVESRLLLRTLRYAITRHQSRQERSEMVAMLSHDIKNPLAVILGYADYLLEKNMHRGATSDDDVLPWIKSSALSILALVENYLDFTRLEEEQLTLATQALSISELLHEVGQRYAGEARHQGLTLVLQVPQSLPAINGDRMALDRVFTNLVANGLKYTSKGGQVTVSAVQRGAEVVIEVADNGPGIAAEELPLLFTKYRRAAATRHKKGTGLGLFITKALVDAHGGRIEVESSLGAGSCFRVSLPIGTK